MYYFLLVADVHHHVECVHQSRTGGVGNTHLQVLHPGHGATVCVRNVDRTLSSVWSGHQPHVFLYYWSEVVHCILPHTGDRLPHSLCKPLTHVIYNSGMRLFRWSVDFCVFWGHFRHFCDFPRSVIKLGGGGGVGFVASCKTFSHHYDRIDV